MGNFTSNNSCENVPTPDINDTLSYMNTGQLAAVFIEVVICITLLLSLLYDGIYLKKHLSQSPRLQAVLFIQSTFVFYAWTSFLAIINPRSSTLSELVFTVYLSVTLKELLWLIIEYLGGDKYAVSKLNGQAASLAVTPFCCICYRCCPRDVYMNGKYLFWVKVGVYQSAIFHIVFDFMSAYLWTNDSYGDGHINYKDPTHVMKIILMALDKISILVAMYALTSLFVSTRQQLQPYHVTGKFMCVQMVMVIAGFQETAFKILAVKLTILPQIITCKGNLAAVDRAAVLHHYLVVFEMLILYVLSRYFHTREEGQIEAVSQRPPDDEENLSEESEDDTLLNNNTQDLGYQSLSTEVNCTKAEKA